MRFEKLITQAVNFNFVNGIELALVRFQRVVLTRKIRYIRKNR